MFNVRNGLTNSTLVAPIFRGHYEFSTTAHAGGGVPNPGRWRRGSKTQPLGQNHAGCCGRFGLRISTPHNDNIYSGRQA